MNLSPSTLARITAIALPLGRVPNTQWLTEPETGRSVPAPGPITPEAVIFKTLSGTRLESCEWHWVMRFIMAAVIEQLGEADSQITLTEKGSAAQPNPKVITLAEAFARASAKAVETGKAAEPVPRKSLPDALQNAIDELGEIFARLDESGLAHQSHPLSSLLFRAQRSYRLLREELLRFETTLP